MTDLSLDTDYASVAPNECGQSFCLSPQTYRALAGVALSLARDWPESSLFIRKLAEPGSGCAVDLYTSNYLFTISIAGAQEPIGSAENANDATASEDNRPMRISLVVASLDHANSEHLLFAGRDTPSDWQRLRFAANRIQ